MSSVTFSISDEVRLKHLLVYYKAERLLRFIHLNVVFFFLYILFLFHLIGNIMLNHVTRNNLNRNGRTELSV